MLMLSLIKRRDNDSLLNHVKEGEIGGGQEEHRSGTSDLYRVIQILYAIGIKYVNRVAAFLAI